MAPCFTAVEAILWFYLSMYIDVALSDTFYLFVIQACEMDSVGTVNTIGVQQTAKFSSDSGLYVVYTAGSGFIS